MSNTNFQTTNNDELVQFLKTESKLVKNPITGEYKKIQIQILNQKIIPKQPEQQDQYTQQEQQDQYTQPEQYTQPIDIESHCIVTSIPVGNEPHPDLWFPDFRDCMICRGYPYGCVSICDCKFDM